MSEDSASTSVPVYAKGQKQQQHNDKMEESLSPSTSSGIMTNVEEKGDDNDDDDDDDVEKKDGPTEERRKREPDSVAEPPPPKEIPLEIDSLSLATEHVTAKAVTSSSNESDNVEGNGDNVDRPDEKEVVEGKAPDEARAPDKMEDASDVPSWLADDSASHQGEEPLLSDIVWKQRSGFGKYAIQHSWERRRLVLEPTRIVYYHLDDSKPHGTLDVASVKVETTMGGSFEIILSTGETKWRVCFDTRLQRETWLSTLQDIEQVIEMKANKATHPFQPGDHVIRWEMLPIAYPIQIHGIVLETGKNCVILADFGLTTYKDGTEKDDDNATSPTKESKWKKLLSFHRSTTQETDKGEKVEKELENSPSNKGERSEPLENSPSKEQEEATADTEKQVVSTPARILAKIKSKHDVFDKPAEDSPSRKQEESDKKHADEEQASTTDPLGRKLDDSPSKKQEEPAKDVTDKKQAGKSAGTSDTKIMDGTKQEAEMRGVMGWGLTTKKKRLSVVVLTDPADIQKWHKVDYGRSLLDKTTSLGSWFNKPSKDGATIKGSTEESAAKADDANRTQSREESAGETLRDKEKEPDGSPRDGSQGTSKKKVGGIVSWFQMSSKDDKYAILDSQSSCALFEKDKDGTETPSESGEEKSRQGGGLGSWFEKLEDEIVKVPSLTEESAVHENNGTEKPQVEVVKAACLKEESAVNDKNGTEKLKYDVVKEVCLTEESAAKDEDGNEKPHDEVVNEPCLTVESIAKHEDRTERVKDEVVKEQSLTEESAVKDENGTESHAEPVDQNVCLAESEAGTSSVAVQVTPELNTQDSSTATVPPNHAREGTEEEPSKQQLQKLPKSDPTEIVLARVNFLLQFGEDVLPPYHVFHSNSECIAVWCKTGRWSTLQAAVFLHSTAIGNAKSSMLLTASVAAAHVVLVPALAVGGLAMITAPWLILKQSKKHWDASTQKLTDLFWSQAEPAVFVAAIEHWSHLQQSPKD